ncbi:dual specificity protein phosphatase 15 isoform X2 [Bos indicus x Bos taurus]|uniref:dual specificity protein phosphatase 15 isoform X2 n=1 Tax=Bos indicus x Bos taurus TaxID=30522 RepID=UPI000F7D2137|nr:dual specificity protein phosphatase 15 isoform X2 [Bos indicus x Bos taurus]
MATPPVFLPGESQGWGAWWAAVYGVAQSRTRLKRLSSSSSSDPNPAPITFLPENRQSRRSPAFCPRAPQGGPGRAGTGIRVSGPRGWGALSAPIRRRPLPEPDGARVGGAPPPPTSGGGGPTRPQQAVVVPRAPGPAHWGFVQPPTATHGLGGCGPRDRAGRRSLWRPRRLQHFPPWPGGAAAAAAAGQSWAELRTPGPPIPARLQAPGPGRQGSCYPCVQRVASWGAPGTPCLGSWGMVLPGLYLGNFIVPSSLEASSAVHTTSTSEYLMPKTQIS